MVLLLKLEGCVWGKSRKNNTIYNFGVYQIVPRNYLHQDLKCIHGSLLTVASPAQKWEEHYRDVEHGVKFLNIVSDDAESETSNQTLENSGKSANVFLLNIKLFHGSSFMPNFLIGI